MTQSGYVLGIDQGTTSTRAILVDDSGRPLWQTSQEITQLFPRLGWVEQNPEEIFDACISVIEELIEESEVSPKQIRAIGIANQRETTIVWDRHTGRAVTNAVGWQCRRTASLCEDLKARGLESSIRAKTGLTIDAYFSSTKIRWILDNIPNGQRRAEEGELLFGTVDSWLIWNLTNGNIHATDMSNASRTMLFNIETLCWDKVLLKEMDIPERMMPEVRTSSGLYGHAGGNFFRGENIPITGVSGDQQASLFGQSCFSPGMAKNTYGTGAFVLMNTGTQRMPPIEGLITTIAWALGEEVTYALEGSVFSTGSTIQWLRDGLQIIKETSEVEALASSVPDNGGVYLVPAFTGLGSPYWDMYARGTMIGLTRSTKPAHIARAALESIAYRTRDIVDAMINVADFKMSTLRVDGGSTTNNMLMQYQADILGTPIERCAIAESTALGAAYLAGLAIGYWNGLEDIAQHWTRDRRYHPKMDEGNRETIYKQWKRALNLARQWVPPAN